LTLLERVGFYENAQKIKNMITAAAATSTPSRTRSSSSYGLLSNADRQRVHRQQDKGYDEHAAGGGPDSGFHGWVHAAVAAS
jgi:hypothetical protein